MRRTSVAKQYQMINLKKPHCIISTTISTQLGIPVSNAKIFGADIKKMGVWSIVLNQDFIKVTQRKKTGSHLHGNMKQSAILGVTEIKLIANVW